MKNIQKVIRIALPLLIIGGGVVAWNELKKPKDVTQPTWENKKYSTVEKRDDAIPVNAFPLLSTTYQTILNSRGETTPGEETELTSETEGQVIYISEQFEIGGFVKKGDVLLKLDSSDLLADVHIAQSRVAQAEATLAQEEARAKQALVNWNEIGYDEDPSDLVLRKPQLKQSEAALKAARAEVEKAERELARAIIRAPYDGIIATKAVSQGQNLSKGRAVGAIIGTSFIEVSLPIAAKDELYLSENIRDIPVTFRNPLRGGNSPEWHGVLTQREPLVDLNTKQLHVRARVLDPYSIQKEGSYQLPVGQPITAKIEGAVIKDVYIVPKSALRGPNSIHIANLELILEELEITPIWTDENSIVFRADLPEGYYCVTSILRINKLGRKLQLIDPEVESSGIEKVVKKESALNTGLSHGG